MTGKRKESRTGTSGKVSQCPWSCRLESHQQLCRLKMFSFMTFVLFLLTVLIRCTGNSSVVRFSVPENHRVCLPCGGAVTSDVVWTHQDQRVPVSYEINEDHQRYLLLPDGSLCLQQIKDADGGMFRCNQQLVADLQVLTGRHFMVSAGRTLLLPCSSSKSKKRWLHQRKGGKWEVVLTRFRNGTVKPERSRLSFGYGALQIQDLQPEDAGEYLCNKELQTTLTVLTQVQPEPTAIQQTSSTSTAVVMETDVVEVKKEEKKRPENALLMVAVIGLALTVFLMAAVCVLLTSMKYVKKRKRRCAAQRREDTELQPWTTSNPQTEHEVYESPSLSEEMIHYASLGRQNWRERPSRTPPDQDHHNVIYSSVITRPAAKPKRALLHPAL